MRFARDDEASVWLRDFVADPENFDWDAGNRLKNAKHGVRREDVESIFYTEPAHDEWRGLILGRSEGGRALALIFTRRGSRLRPISCRSMRREERRLYEANIQERS